MSETAVSDDVQAYRDSLAEDQQAAYREAHGLLAAAAVCRSGSLKAILKALAEQASKDALSLTMLLQDGRALYRRAG